MKKVTMVLLSGIGVVALAAVGIRALRPVVKWVETTRKEHRQQQDAELEDAIKERMAAQAASEADHIRRTEQARAQAEGRITHEGRTTHEDAFAPQGTLWDHGYSE